MHSRYSLVAVACLAACGGGTEVPRYQPPPQPDAARAAWVVSERAAGPLRIGMTLDEASRALGVRLVPMNGAASGCGVAELAEGSSDLSVMLMADTLVRFDVVDARTRTAEGIGVGSSEAAVLAAYRGRVITEPHDDDAPAGHYLTVPTLPDSAFAYVFETDGQQVTVWRAGRREEVGWGEGCS